MSIAEDLRSLLDAGRFSDARRRAEAAADEAEPGPLQQLLGRLAWLEGDQAGARSHLDAAAAIGPLPADLYTLRAQLTLEDDPAGAEASLRSAAEAAEPSGRALAAWGDRLGATGRWAEAAAIFARAVERAETHAARASAALGQIACGEALDDPALGEAGLSLLTAQWAALSEEDALPALASLVRIAAHRAHSLADRLALAGLPEAARLTLEARIAWLTGDHPAALRAARSALEKDPEDDAARRLYAELLLMDDAVAEARPLVRSLVERGAAPPDLALALLEATGRAGRDRDMLDEVLTLARQHPHHPGIRIEAARALTDAGRESEARAMLGQAMADDARLRTRLAPLETFFAASRAGLPALLDRLGVGPDPALVRVRMGHNSLLYQVQVDSADHFAKVFLPGARSRAHVEATARLETTLGEMPGAPLAVPRAIAFGGSHSHALGEGWAVVMNGIPGRSLRRSLQDVRHQLTPMHGFEVGRALGELHGMLDASTDPMASAIVDGTAGISDAIIQSHQSSQSSEAWQRPVPEDGVRGGFSSAADWAAGRRDWRALLDGIGEGLVEARLAEALADRMEPLFARWRRVLPALPTGVIHGDFGWHNLLWQDGRVTGVVDFDYAARDIRAADLANAIHRTAFDFNRLQRGLSPRPRPEVAAAIVRGYRSTGRPLPVPDFEALDAVARGVRCVYTLSLARADRASLTGRQYGRPARLIEALIRQLDWLDAHDGLGAMLRRAA